MLRKRDSALLEVRYSSVKSLSVLSHALITWLELERVRVSRAIGASAASAAWVIHSTFLGHSGSSTPVPQQSSHFLPVQYSPIPSQRSHIGRSSTGIL